IFTRYLWAFELTGALLITATVGAMILAHREQIGPVRTQRMRSIERFRTGRHVTPLPPPGVYARDNAVDAPARLPDGTYSALSVSSVLRAGHTIVGPPRDEEGRPVDAPRGDAQLGRGPGGGPEAEREWEREAEPEWEREGEEAGPDEP